MKKASSDTNSERLRIHEYYEVFFLLFKTSASFCFM